MVATMNAVVFKQYGSPDVLELLEIPRPVPKDDEVLIRVQAASINDWDWEALHGTPFVNRLMFGVLKPKKQILGSDIAGTIEAAGNNARRFQPGDAVYGDLSGAWGGFAEYVCARETALALKPSGMTYEQAAAIPQAAMLAVQALRDAGRLQRGQRLLINGAGGGVGTFAIQLAKLYGADVTGIDSGEKLDLMRSLGADHVIDYRKEDFTTSAQRYDLILDVKTHRSVSECARALTAAGTYVTVGGSMARLFQALLLWPWIRLTTRKKLRLVALKPNKDLDYINELFETGKITPVLDGPYELEALPDAFRYFGEGRHKGKVIIRCAATSDGR